MNKLEILKKNIKDRYNYDDETVEIQLTNFIFGVNTYYKVDLRETVVSMDVDYEVLCRKVKTFDAEFIKENIDLLMEVAFDPITVMMYNSLNRMMDYYETKINNDKIRKRK